MKYITTIQASDKWNISQRRVAFLCAQKRIPGATKIGKTWLIPSTCQKPEDERFEVKYKVDSETSCVSEPEVSYLAKTELMLNPELVQFAEEYYSEKGKSLSEGINDYISNLASEKKKDCRSSYPAGFFNMFGCASKLDFPDSIDDIIPEDVNL